MRNINGAIMKNKIKLFFVVLAFLNVNIAYSFERIDLPPNRTSMEYAPQAREFINKVANYKWEAENGEGFHFVESEAV